MTKVDWLKDLKRPCTRRELRRNFPEQIADGFYLEITEGLKAARRRLKDAKLLFVKAENGITTVDLYLVDEPTRSVFARHWPPGDTSPVEAVVSILSHSPPEDIPPRGLYESGSSYGSRVLRAREEMRTLLDRKATGAWDEMRRRLYSYRIGFMHDGLKYSVSIQGLEDYFAGRCGGVVDLPQDKLDILKRRAREISDEHVDCYNAHYDILQSLTRRADVRAYDITQGWPDAPQVAPAAVSKRERLGLTVYTNPNWAAD